MNRNREPFDAFEVHKVAEFNDNHGSTYIEPIDTESDQDYADDEAVRQFFTVYGHRSFPDGPKAPEIEFVDDSSYFVNGIPTSMTTYHEYAAWLVAISADTTGLGATAISDYDDRESAIDLAYALAGDRPVHDFTDGQPMTD
jgi:hypothetical protein